MDTPCIPSETSLRNECIRSINEVFTRSKVTLVCDRDIVDVDISDVSIDLLESLLATLLVCDWNLRAWTLLEGMRSRENLYLLCKDNKTISVLEILKTVYWSGHINLSILAMTSGHLLPSYQTYEGDDYDWRSSLFYDGNDKAEERLEFLPIGEAATLLSHRHMTRNQDDVIIWGYLIGNTFLRDEVQLWRSRIGHNIPTGSIVSSSPRIKGCKGLSWAPERPTFRHASGNEPSGTKAYMASREESFNGEILEKGLWASWLFREVVFKRDESLEGQLKFFPSVTLEAIESRAKKYSRFALLRARTREGPGFGPVVYRETGHGPLVVLCASRNPKEGWEWIDVFEWIYEWQDSRPTQKSVDGFEHRGILLI